MFSKREDVYRVVKAFAARGERMSPEAKRYNQFLVWIWIVSALFTKTSFLNHVKFKHV